MNSPTPITPSSLLTFYTWPLEPTALTIVHASIDLGEKEANATRKKTYGANDLNLNRFMIVLN
jgi:hypothetical protein